MKKKDPSGFVGKTVSYRQGRGYATGQVARVADNGKLVITKASGSETTRDASAVKLAS